MFEGNFEWISRADSNSPDSLQREVTSPQPTVSSDGDASDDTDEAVYRGSVDNGQPIASRTRARNGHQDVGHHHTRHHRILSH